MAAASALRRPGALKRFWRNLHLWLGVGLFILLVPIALSGAVLVYHDAIDEMMRTPREAVAAAQPADLALAVTNARKAAGDGFSPMSISFPDSARAPLSIALRGPAKPGERPTRLVAYVDRADARVLDVVDFRNTFFGTMHFFHENLLIPAFYGRDIVGWGGVAMLILSLTGLYLWWPRRGQWGRAFGWRRAPSTSSNLHYMTGFWVCFPLALVSLTGVYLAWPQQGRAVLSSMAPLTPRAGGGPGGGPLLATPQHSPSDIYALAAARPNTEVEAIFFPNPQGGWRVRVQEQDRAEPVTLMINDRSGAVAVVAPQSGDRVQSWIRWLHEGSHAGPVWRLIIFITGLMPTLLGVTGILIWLRQRRQRAMVKAGPPRSAAAQATGARVPAE